MKKMEEAVSIEILTERLFDTSTIANELHKLAYVSSTLNKFDRKYFTKKLIQKFKK